MWTRHLFSLLHRMWTAFHESLGATTLGFVAPLVVSIISIAVTLYYILRQQGRDAMLKHWKENAGIALRVTVIVSALVYGPIFIYESAKTVYEDHQSLVKQRDDLAQSNINLALELRRKRGTLLPSEPAFYNMTHILSAFMSYRTAIQTVGGRAQGWREAGAARRGEFDA